MIDEPVPPAARWSPGRWLRSPLAGKQATHGIYIEIVVLALILALDSKGVTDANIVVTLSGAMLALILAEFYAYYVGTMIGDGRRPAGPEIRAVIVGTAWSLAAALPPIALLMLGVVGLVAIDTGFLAAKVAGAAVIGGYALVASRRAGLSHGRSAATAVLFLAIAAALVVLKGLVH